MEALEFLKEYQRMCTVHKDCNGCPLVGTACAGCCELSEKQMIDIVYKTEQWSKEHPIITNARKFKEVFGLTIECDTNLDRDRRAFTIQSKDESYRKKQSEWLDLPYEEPEKEVQD